MSFAVLFLIVMGGLCGPLCSGFRRFSVPLVVGEITSGVVLGASGLRWIDGNDPILQFLSMVAVSMLMFLVGTKLPLHDPGLRKAIRHSAISTALAFVLAIPVAWLIAYLTGVQQLGMFLLLVAASSTNVAMPMVLERKLSGPTVMMTTMWVLLADIATILILPLVLQPDRLLSTIVGALVVTGLAIVTFIAMRFWKESQSGVRYRALSKERGWALDLRMSLAMLFGLSWMALTLGTSSLVAGFAAGAVVTLLDQPRRFTKQLVGLCEGFFVPLFYVTLGAKLDLHELVASPLNLSITALIVIGSLLVHLVVSKAVGLPLASGLVASSQLGLPATLVALCLSSGGINAGQGAAIMAAALVLVLACSVGTARLAKYSVPGYEPSRNPNSEEVNGDQSEPPAKSGMGNGFASSGKKDQEPGEKKN